MFSRIVSLICILALGSCLNTNDYELKGITVNPDLSMPLASGEISLLSVLSDKDSSYIKVDNDGLLYLSYSDTLASKEVHDLLNLPDNTTMSYFDLPAGTQPPSGSDVSGGTINKLLDLGMSPEKLSEALLKSGDLQYTVVVAPSNGVTPAGFPFEVGFTLTDVLDNSTQQPLEFKVGAGTATRSLANYKLRMNQNKFNVSLELILKKRTSTFFVAPGTKVSVLLAFKNMVFENVLGFFGDQITTISPRSVDVSIFDSSLKDASVSFVQPTMSMSVVNDFGVPCEVTFTKLEARKSGSTLAINISPASPVNLAYPSVMGQSATTNVTVNNVTNLINFRPTEFYYAASARINKALSSGSNFMTGDSRLRVILDTKIPLYGRAENIIMRDTLSLDLTSVDKSKVEKASLKINSTNEMPLDARIQFYLTDASYHIIDSLFVGNQTYFVKGSKVKPDGELLSSSGNDFIVNLSQDRIDNVFSTHYLIVKAVLNTTKDDQGNLLNVKFKSAYRLKLHLGLNAKLVLTTQ